MQDFSEEEKIENGREKKILKKIPSFSRSNITAFILSFLVVLLGSLTGFFLSELGNKTSSEETLKKVSEDQDLNVDQVDDSQFSDTASGILAEGGIDGEGNYHLERPGGPSQNVYLTSTVIDLKKFVGKKVQVWGQTLSGMKAGWLIDVVRIKEIK